MGTSNGLGRYKTADSNEISISRNGIDQTIKFNPFLTVDNNSLQLGRHHRHHYHKLHHHGKQSTRNIDIKRQQQQHLSICANDGNTYKNQCELLRHACLNSLDLRPLFYGSCDDQFEDQLISSQEQQHFFFPS